MKTDVLEVVGGLFNEALLIAYNVGMMERGEDANLVECVFFLTLVEVVQLHLLYGVDLVVDQSLRAVHARVSPLPCLKR